MIGSDIIYDTLLDLSCGRNHDRLMAMDDDDVVPVYHHLDEIVLWLVHLLQQYRQQQHLDDIGLIKFISAIVDCMPVQSVSALPCILLMFLVADRYDLAFYQTSVYLILNTTSVNDHGLTYIIFQKINDSHNTAVFPRVFIPHWLK